jgi:hypothetical protein
VYKGGIDDKPTSWGKIDPDTKNYVRLALADLKAVLRPYSPCYPTS